MIIETPNGAVLEVFWRTRGAQPWSEATALRFVSHYRLDRQGLQGIRWLLSDRANPGATWRASDAAMLQRTAWLMARDSVVVAEFGGTERWPGSGYILGSGWDSSILFWRDRLNLHKDLHRVLHWLGEMRDVIRRTEDQKAQKTPGKISESDSDALRTNQEYIETLREVLDSAPGVPDYSKLNDHDFLQLVWNHFEAGELLAIYHRYPGIAEPGPPDGPPDGPTPPKPPDGPDDPDDPSDNPFIPGVCLLKAAKDGAPFVTIPESTKAGGST